MSPHTSLSTLFFFNDTATTEIYTLSLHDALPISKSTASRARSKLLTLNSDISQLPSPRNRAMAGWSAGYQAAIARFRGRSEEHTSELQSQSNLVCRLLLEKKKKKCETIHDKYHMT